jgi:hypothetical protein
MVSNQLQTRFRLNPEPASVPIASFVVALLVALSAAIPCHGQWKKTIDCPEGRDYRDFRQDAGRDEYCILNLPGSLWVRDGPSRFWFSEGHFGEVGSYQLGRKVGHWRECDRFDRCHEKDYDPLYPNEKAHGVRPEMPVRHVGGKYVFDFGSCRSTWVTRQTTNSFLELNIHADLIRCGVTYIPSTEKDRPAGNQSYFCEVPYAVGVREFDSLDLRSELPKAGLPQFCRQDSPDLTANGRIKEMAVAIWGDEPFIDGITGKPVHGWAPLANALDVECASVRRPQSGPERLTLRLNRYVENIVLERTGKEAIRADACGGDLQFSSMATSKDASGRALFTLGLSGASAVAARQRACITSEFKLQPACASQ